MRACRSVRAAARIGAALAVVAAASAQGQDVTISVRKSIVDANRFTFLLDATLDVRRVAFGIILPPGLTTSDVHFGFCVTHAVPFTLSKRECTETGQGPPTDMGSTVNTATSFTLGPDPLLSRSDTLYVALEALITVPYGTFESLNPGLATFVLGELVYDSGVPLPSQVVPEVTLAGMPSELLDGHPPFEDTFATPIDVADVAVIIDADADGWEDVADNCANVSNLAQLDSGGVDSPSNPGGLIPDTIGDACQCGDVTDDGIVDAADLTPIRQNLLGATVSGPFEPTKCNVTGPHDEGATDCNLSDIALLDLSPGIQQLCAPAQLWYRSALAGEVPDVRPGTLYPVVHAADRPSFEPVHRRAPGCTQPRQA